MKGKYQFTETTDLKNFKVIDSEVKMNFHPRHGTIIPITRDELIRITDNGQACRIGYNTEQSCIARIPCRPWNLILKQDKEILYLFHNRRTTRLGRMVLHCFLFNRPEELELWRRYAGFEIRTGTLGEWKCLGTVYWRKLIKGEYKYFFYYSGNPAKGGGKQIGVAMADSPTGPFTDLGQPIITDSPVGHGQQIDVDVFTDPVSGKPYLYWGNGYMAAPNWIKIWSPSRRKHLR